MAKLRRVKVRHMKGYHAVRRKCVWADCPNKPIRGIGLCRKHWDEAMRD